jgi:hypothetical protein
MKLFSSLSLTLILSFVTGFTFSQDQVLDWFTYFGSSEEESTFNELAFGPDGDVYLASRVENDELIFGENIHQDFYAGDTDALLAKFDASGQLIWSTHFGGTGMELVNSVAALADGRIAIAGSTSSDEGIIFGPAHQNFLNGANDNFIAVFNPDGSLDWSTFFGGESFEDGRAFIDTDSQGNIVLASRTFSFDLATNGAWIEDYNDVMAGNYYIAKFSQNGELNWSTYVSFPIGGFHGDISIDGNDNIYYANATSSTGGLASEDAHQTEANGNSSAFLLKLSPEGNLLWSTYISGEDDESFVRMCVDDDGNAYVSCYTESTTGFATEGAFQMENIPGPNSSNSSGINAAISKFSPDGNKLWGTYYGNEYSMNIEKIKPASNGVIFTYYSQFDEFQIHGDNPFQDGIAGGRDAFVTKFSSEGDMVWSTAFGGASADRVYALDVQDEKIVLSGRTVSAEFYADENSWEDELQGDWDLYVAVLSDNVLSTFDAPNRKEGAFLIYPNPSISNSFRIKSEKISSQVAEISVYNYLGQLVMEENNHRLEEEIIHNLDPGFYLIELKIDGELFSERFMVAGNR